MGTYNCLNHISNFTTSCIPGMQPGSFSLNPVINNIHLGVCPELMFEIFTSCVTSTLSYVVDFDEYCYQNLDNFKSCSPGFNAHLTKNPSLCWWLSNLIFLTNESILLLEGTVRNSAIVATYLLRNQETEHCSSTCSDQNFDYIGKREQHHELMRYAVSGANRVAMPTLGAVAGYVAGGPAGSVVSGGLYYFALKYFNYFIQMVTSFSQQRARNLDFLESHQKCASLQRFGVGPYRIYRAASKVYDLAYPVVTTTLGLVQKAASFILNFIASQLPLQKISDGFTSLFDYPSLQAGAWAIKTGLVALRNVTVVACDALYVSGSFFYNLTTPTKTSRGHKSFAYSPSGFKKLSKDEMVKILSSPKLDPCQINNIEVTQANIDEARNIVASGNKQLNLLALEALEQAATKSLG